MSSVGGNSPGDHLIDTNVLLRTIEAGHPMHATARQALRHLTLAGAALFVATQNLIEFWVVATRPVSANGLGLTTAQTVSELLNVKSAFHVLSDTPAVFTEWERIAATYDVQGKQAHDTRLVAVMKVHGIAKILSFNAGDFTRYVAGEGIAVVDPVAVASSP